MQVFDNKNQIYLSFYAEKSLLVYNQAKLFYFTIGLMLGLSQGQVEGNTYLSMFNFSLPCSARYPSQKKSDRSRF